MEELVATLHHRGLLDNRIPPPFVFLLVGAGMWLGTFVAPVIMIDNYLRFTIVGAFAIFGLLLAGLGFNAFGRAKTTIDPVHVERASTLVTTGVYRYTRNPMYVGLISLLIGWTVFLAVPWTALGPIVFALYITRFQLIPEERALAIKFGADYEHYRKRVRRWL